MKTTTNRSPLACTAIAAVLAAVSTPAFAQDTAVPDAAPAAAPAPIVLPEFKPQPAPPPVVEPAPAASVTAAPETKPATPAPRTAARTAQRAAPAAAAPAAAIAASPVVSAAPAEAASAAAPQAVAAPVPLDEPQPQPAASSADSNAAELGLGLAGLLALGGLGVYAASRRRRRVSEHGTVVSAEPAPTTLRTQPANQTAAPSFTTSFAKPVQPAYAAPARPLYATASGSAGAASIPPGPLPTGTALAALIERMVSAEPDADNPFKGEKRRRARVRWLLKQHEYRLRDPDGMTAEDRYNAKGFDFRTWQPTSKLTADEGAGKEVVSA